MRAKIGDLKRKIIILSLSLLAVAMQYVSGQISVTMSYRQATENAALAVPIVIGFPAGNVFSTDEISRQFPAAKIPVEKISVNYPDLNGALDTAAIIWYLKPENYSAKGEINIVLVTVDADSVKTFYVDNNNDRTFNNNEDKFHFGMNEEKREVKIQIMGSVYKYTLMNPDYVPPAVAPSKTGFYSMSWIKASKKPSLNFDFSFITGGGDAQVSFVPSTGTIESYRYQANIVGAIKPTIALDFSWFNFHITAFGAYERLQYDETVLYAFSPNLKGGKQRYYDRGTWPTSKLHGGLSVEYDIRFKAVYFSPFASYSVFKNINERNFDKAIVPPPDADYHEMYSKEAGLKLKVPVGDKTLIYIKYTYSRSWFDVTDFIYPYEEGTYNVDYVQNFFGLGVQYRLFK